VPSVPTGSTGSHHPEPLSSVTRKSAPGDRGSTGSDVLGVLSNPTPTPTPSSDPNANSDDAPTVITRPQPPSGPIPLSAVTLGAGDTPLIAGRRLGHYELIETVGAGGMAAVLKARDLELGRIVALKILPPEAARDPESVNRFKQEARAAARLDHENVARVYYCGEDQGLHFIAFEFVEGENLRVLIDRRGVLPVGDCVRYMIQVATGLNHAAERGVVHRDIKPSNIIITPDGRAKIVDMGLARHLESGSVNGGVTHSGVTLGTFDYISPEQAMDPRRADVRSDIYSLGCAFYHALTGQPPVPEGTAAKKLHAHQHIDPLDPRELNPAIPDELAAILSRMMAKVPEHRYQTPKELIAHLKGLAERLDLGSDLGVSDSNVQPAPRPPLPEVPHLRLGGIAAAAVITLAVVVFVLSTQSPNQPIDPPWATTKPTAKSEPPPTVAPTPPRTPPVADGVVRTAEQLASKLADPTTTKIELAGGLFDLTTLTEPVVFRGKEIELIGSVNPPTTIRVHPGDASPLLRGAGLDRPSPGTFSISQAEWVTLTGIRFEVADPRNKEPRYFAAGLTIADAGHVSVTDCVFSVAPSAARSGNAGSIRVVRSSDRLASQIRVLRCVFGPANFAVWAPEQAVVTLSDCGVGPHESALRVDDDPTQAAFFSMVDPQLRETVLHLERSSFLLDANSALLGDSTALANGHSIQVSASYCVFAPVGTNGLLPIFPELSGRRPTVIRLSEPPTGTIQYKGQAGHKNVYYRIEPLAVTVGETTKYYTFDDCRAAKLPIEDTDAVLLAQRPWSEPDPLATLAGSNPWRAFRLRLSDPAVFTPKDPAVRVVGAQFHNPLGSPPRRAYPEVQWPPDLPKTPPTSEPRQIVWQPDATEPLPPGTYSDLATLLRKVQPGDEILIRHNGLLVLDTTIELEKARGAASGELRLTFKPDRGYTPVLAPPGGERVDQTLFRLINGEVTFEGVQFALKPSRPRDQSVAAVTVVGGKGCWFKNCVFTLAEEADSRAAVVLIADPAKIMAMEATNRLPPVIRFERCILRGKGRGIWTPVSRAMELELSQCLTAIDGPLFLAEPAGKILPGARTVLRLHRLTALVGGPIVELHGGRVGEMRASGLVPVEVQADECLFAAVPTAGQPLVAFDGIDPTEVKTILEWQVRTGNRYANFPPGAPAVILRPNSDVMLQREWDWNQWITFAGEPGNKPVGTVIFEQGPQSLRDLATIRPADVVITDVTFPDVVGSRATDAGADVRLLPLPKVPGQRPD
jgi:serine/threonine protein kinase